MEKEKLGIDALVDTAVDILNTADKVAAAALDGIGVTDLVTLLTIAPALNRIRKTGRTALNQLIDLTVEESKEASAQIAFRTGLPQTGIIPKVNEAFTLLVNAYAVYKQAEMVALDVVRFGKSLRKSKTA